MEWITATAWDWLITLGWITALAIVFAGLVRLMPCNRGMFWWTNLRAVGTDLCYWFVTPIFVRVSRTVLMIAGIAFLFGGRAPGFALVHQMPIWLQCIAIQLGQDVMLYWMHRGFHTPLGWRFHSVHHSPTVLDWMSAPRNHLVNNLLTFILAEVVVLLLGFAPAALLILAPINVVWSSMVHANLNWTFGPLRFFIASPVFHRWHHTLEAEGLNKNFAPTFPFLDLIFGTFYMPPGKLPEHFGNGEHDFPEGFLWQLVYPFVKKTTEKKAPQRKAA
jgi:sterol desaturase/sphingolipid hydroxylase (fatty acid hydroxylase superfamily)